MRSGMADRSGVSEMAVITQAVPVESMMPPGSIMPMPRAGAALVMPTGNHWRSGGKSGHFCDGGCDFADLAPSPAQCRLVGGVHPGQIAQLLAPLAALQIDQQHLRSGG